MKKAVILLFFVFLTMTVLAQHECIRWTPWGFLMFNGNAWSPTANFFFEITGRQTAAIETIPSGNPQELANQCQLIANQIMQIFREKKADKIAIHPGFIEGCPQVNIGLPAVMPFISFEKAEAEKKREEEKRVEEELKKTPPVELDIAPSKDLKEMTAQTKTGPPTHTSLAHAHTEYAILQKQEPPQYKLALLLIATQLKLPFS